MVHWRWKASIVQVVDVAILAGAGAARTMLLLAARMARSEVGECIVQFGVAV